MEGHERLYVYLCCELNKAACRYYYEPDLPPIYTDAQYDAMQKELEELENQYPELRAQESPSRTVGSPIGNSSLPKVQHLTPMLSLRKVHSLDELKAWDFEVRQKLGARRLA